MRCPCGAEVEPGKEKCAQCQALEAKVQVLTPEEKQQFQGVTIEQEGESIGKNPGSSGFNSGSRIYVKQVSFGSGTGLMVKLLVGAVIAALVVFIAMPVALLLLAVGFIWLILR
ncbi:MAG: hypothetical protein ABFC84_07850 [Veillonellales bacterium]